MTTDVHILDIANDHWQVGLVPRFGGTVSHGRARLGDEWVDVLRPTRPEHLMVPPQAASYPLVPWSNRIRDARLLWAGRSHSLRHWPGQAAAMHGTGFEFPWEVAESGATHASLVFDSRPHVGVNFPWDFTARFDYALDGPRFTWTLGITNVGGEAFPAGLGHHPHFVRRLRGAAGPLGEEVLVQIDCEQSYELEECLALGPAGPIEPRVDWRRQRSLGEVFVDDCLTGRTSSVAARLEYPGALRVAMEADELFGHVVIYIPVGEDFFALEPVTNANDAFTLAEQGVEGLGLFTVEPGQTVSASFSLVADAS